MGDVNKQRRDLKDELAQQGWEKPRHTVGFMVKAVGKIDNMK